MLSFLITFLLLPDDSHCAVKTHLIVPSCTVYKAFLDIAKLQPLLFRNKCKSLQKMPSHTHAYTHTNKQRVREEKPLVKPIIILCCVVLCHCAPCNVVLSQVVENV